MILNNITMKQNEWTTCKLWSILVNPSDSVYEGISEAQ